MRAVIHVGAIIALGCVPQAGLDLNRASDLYTKGNYEEALKAYLRAAEREPRYGWPYFGAGNCLRELKRPEEAVDAYRKAVTALPEQWEFHYWLGATLLDLGRLDEAANSLGQAAVLAPGDARPRVSLGLVRYRSGMRDEARREFEAALALDTNALWEEAGRAYAAVRNGVPSTP